MDKELDKAAEEYAEQETMDELAVRAFKDGAKWNEEQLKTHIIEYIKKCPTITKYHKTLYCIDLEAFKESI